MDVALTRKSTLKDKIGAVFGGGGFSLKAGARDPKAKPLSAAEKDI